MNTTTSRTFQTVAVGLVVVGMIALALGGYLSPLTRYVINPLVSAQTWVATRYQAIEDYFSAPQDMARLQQQVAELEAENSRLEAEIIDLNQQVADTAILSALVNFARVQPENNYVTGQVIGRDTNPFLRYVIINRGSDHGLRRGMPVVTDKGLVGRIDSVIAGAARIQLITDPGSTINVRIQPSRAQAVLQGQITGDVSLDMIPQSAEVQPGDLVLTSGLGGNYPKDILVGQVTGVRSRDFDLFQSASVQPVVDFQQLEIVLVITNFRPVDISPLVPAPEAGAQ